MASCFSFAGYVLRAVVRKYRVGLSLFQYLYVRESPSSNLGSSSSAGPWNLSDSKGFVMRGGKVFPYFFPYWPETRLMKDSIRAALACFI